MMYNSIVQTYEMGLDFSSYFKYLPSPSEREREKLENLGFTFIDDNGVTTKYTLPFGWGITRPIAKPTFFISDGKTIRVVIDENGYEIDREIELK
jgi:hypothetical protein